MNHTCIMILAAGASVRLGRPKQLLPFQNKTLVQHIADEAIKTNAGAVIVVTGANANKVLAVLDGGTIYFAHNQNWQQGMGGSVKTGMTLLKKLPSTFQSVILCVCDQPFVSKELFQTLVEKKRQTRKGIIACAYSETFGTPVLFDGKYFKQLQTLTVTEGAKTLLQKYQYDVATVSFPLGQIDIDTGEDYDSFLRNKNDAT